MKISHRLLCCLGCVVVLAGTLAAPNVAAQTSGGTTTYDSDQSTRRKPQGIPAGSKLPPAAPSPVASVPEPWPRLEAGAVLCKTRDDLVRYQKRGVAGSAAGAAPDCRIIGARAGVRVLVRDDPSHTQVALTDAPQQTGWTDVWLPSKAPN